MMIRCVLVVGGPKVPGKSQQWKLELMHMRDLLLFKYVEILQRQQRASRKPFSF